MSDDDSPMWVPPARPQPMPEWPDYPDPKPAMERMWRELDEITRIEFADREAYDEMLRTRHWFRKMESPDVP